MVNGEKFFPKKENYLNLISFQIGQEKFPDRSKEIEAFLDKRDKFYKEKIDLALGLSEALNELVGDNKQLREILNEVLFWHMIIGSTPFHPEQVKYLDLPDLFKAVDKTNIPDLIIKNPKNPNEQIDLKEISLAKLLEYLLENQ